MCENAVPAANEIASLTAIHGKAVRVAVLSPTNQQQQQQHQQTNLGKPLRTPVKSAQSTPIKTSTTITTTTATTTMGATPKHGSGSRVGVIKASGGKRLTAVQRAQEEALRNFGGLSLGNVLEEAKPHNLVLDAPDAYKPVPKTADRSSTKSDAFGGTDLGSLNVKVRDALWAASDKHNSAALTPVCSRPVTKLEAFERDAAAVWGSEDLSKLDVKPPLSLVEKAQLELKQKRQQPQEVRPAFPGVEEHAEEDTQSILYKDHERLADEARQKRDADREARRLERLRKEKELEAKREQVRSARNRGRVAPFMNQQQQQQQQQPKQPSSHQQPANPTPEMEMLTAMFAAPPPNAAGMCQKEPVASSTPVEEVVTCNEAVISDPVRMQLSFGDAIASAPSPSSSSSPIVMVVEDDAGLADMEADDVDEEGEGEYQTAPGTPVAADNDDHVDASPRGDASRNLSNANVSGAIEDMLEGISICNLSDLSNLLSPPTNTDDQDSSKELELVATLPKHKTPLHRLPYHERQVDEEMQSAIQELAEHDVGRAEAGLESMRQSLNGYTVKELKEELKERGLKVTGRKSELVDRLIDWHRENGARNGGDQCVVM